MIVNVQSAQPDFLEEISVGRHSLKADEPIEAGGKDLAPNPYELLLAALGSCKGITIRMYAARRNWPLEGVHIALSHTRVHADDCANCELEAPMTDQIDVAIRLAGALSAEQRERLLAVAEKCPIQRALNPQIRIRTQLSG
ncbi:MAG TPA: OsmC family protein [Steroidobacteraceae bacterium]|jgi:uncharacterized OsmC-like protein|nr:OsmC family protein [Steroidobacteraceae bacterium]